MSSYEPKHVLKSFSGKPFVHTCILQVIYERSAYGMPAIWSDTFFEWFRFEWDIPLESYSPKHASVVLWYNIVCIQQAHWYIAIWCVSTHDNKLTYLMTAYYTHNDGFTANVASFCKEKVGQLHYTLQCLFNYANIKFEEVYYRTSLQDCCLVEIKKEHKVWEFFALNINYN